MNKSERYAWHADDIEVLELPRAAGDVEGHPFHGNQWTKGSNADPDSDIEGGGPERAKWAELNKKVGDITDVYFDAKEAHRALIKGLEQKYNLPAFASPDYWSSEGKGARDVLRADPDYLASVTKVNDAYAAMKAAEIALGEQAPKMRVEAVTNIATDVAQQLGVDPSIIHVVDKDPTEFVVGVTHFTEGGHYRPSTGQIEINARNIGYANAPGVKGLAAHEISHAMYDDTKKEAELERYLYLKKAMTGEGHENSPWYRERFTQDLGGGNLRVKPEYQEEIAKEFPASTALSMMAGGRLFSGPTREMVAENGHSSYAKSYWTDESLRDNNYKYDNAINETMAEVTRWMTYPASWQNEPSTPKESSSWVKLTKNVHEFYRKKHTA